jgi:hypothetical protein
MGRQVYNHDTPVNTLFSLRYGERKSKVKRLLRIILGRGELLAEANERRAWHSTWDENFTK